MVSMEVLMLSNRATMVDPLSVATKLMSLLSTLLVFQ